MQNKPTETGLYLARKSYATSWNYIVKIQGEKLFFTYIAWNLDYPKHEFLEGTDPIKFIFGDKIEQSAATYIIDVPEQAGLYWAITCGDVVLVYIIGEAPYMSCFVWDVVTNKKSRILNVSSLSFLEQIDMSSNSISK